MLFTQWVGHAWEQISSQKEMIIRSFRKCGISVPIDGSEDSAINIEGITDYEVGSDTDSDGSISDDEDPFADLD